MRSNCRAHLSFEGLGVKIGLGLDKEVVEGVVFGANREALVVKLSDMSRNGPIKFGHRVIIIRE